MFVSFFNTFQINGVFDTISYSKGASVLRMLDNVILEEGEFIAGISSFLVSRKTTQHALDSRQNKKTFARFRTTTSLTTR